MLGDYQLLCLIDSKFRNVLNHHSDVPFEDKLFNNIMSDRLGMLVRVFFCHLNNLAGEMRSLGNLYFMSDF